MNFVVFSELNSFQFWFCFASLFLVVFLSSLLIPRYIVDLFHFTKTGAVFAATFFVAIITSLPEVVSMIGLGSKAATLGDPSLLILGWSSIFGGNMYTIMTLSVLHILALLFVGKKLIDSAKKIKFTILILIFFDSLYLFSFTNAFSFLNYAPFPVDILSGFTLMTVILLIGYVFFLSTIYNLSESDNSLKGKHLRHKLNNKLDNLHKKNTILKLFSITFILSTLLVLAMIGIISMLQVEERWRVFSNVAIGGIFLSFITSSPEIWTSLSFFLLGLAPAAAGVVFGSEIFNRMIIQVLPILTGQTLDSVFESSDEFTAELIDAMSIFRLAAVGNLIVFGYYYFYKNSLKYTLSVSWIIIGFGFVYFVSKTF